MTEASDVDFILIFNNSEELPSARQSLCVRPCDDWPQDIVFHTKDSFKALVAKGGGAAWLAAREGRVVYEKRSS